MGHTPGPWKISEGAYGWQTRVSWAYGAAGAQCHIDTDGEGGPYTSGADPRAEANATLIAAAPGLLAACKDLAQQLTDMHAATNDLGLAERFEDDSINMLSDGRAALDSARAAIARAVGK